MDCSLPQNLEEYFASWTTIKFECPFPLLGGLIPAGTSDDPSSGPYILTFKELPFWVAAYKSCETKIMFQCEEYARIGCAIIASNKCKPAWWQSLIGWKSMDLTKREQCERIETKACLVVANEKCVGFTKVKCMTPFLNARITVGEK
ncbi:hypothetical protein ES332_A05G084800v1 [Gossypium tomentosum]|uniref:Uncharacterized protein n=1 Tax=Gossypium tomentosum TaxID=34277 RepID=A0A5D2QCC3_GOSTO|nr:hypothetical protein ES332_A05G084800v1 [Gossypium tomentosum]